MTITMSETTTRTVRKTTLNNGKLAPVIAFGTGTSHAWTDSTKSTVMALERGYSHLDCAYHYKNQKFTGMAVVGSGMAREQLYITTKAGSFDHPPEHFDARTFLKSNLADLGVEYVDLYLIHADLLVSDIQTAWSQMEQLQHEGLCKSIGVSNFSTKSLKTLLESCTIKPAVNQIEFHPNALSTYLPTLLPLCKTHKIKIASYGPLVPLVRRPSDPVIDAATTVAAARGLGETVGQILLEWNQQYTGGIVVTTSKNPSRMSEQIRPFIVAEPYPELSDVHLDLIAEAGKSDPYRHWGGAWPNFMNGEGGITYPKAERGNYGKQKAAQELSS
ncbi:hypothetical protein Q5752_000649 [Cryptotrichosporon argae]